ncbi:hypothetical protein LDENG_00213010, partial [Lucifuga dentata]
RVSCLYKLSLIGTGTSISRKKVVLPKKLININVCIFSLTSKTATQKQVKSCYFRQMSAKRVSSMNN